MDAIRKKMKSLKDVTDGLYAIIKKFEDETKESNSILDLLVHLVLLLVTLVGLVEFVKSLIKVNLKAVDFLSIISDVALSLLEDGVGLLGLILELLDDGVETIGL